MISEITLIGFKSFLNRQIKLKQLTVLTGLNSSGKSSIIQALLMMEKAKKDETSLLLEGHGSIEEIKNIYYSKQIQLKVADEFGNFFITDFTSAVQNRGINYLCINKKEFNFPEIIYISANRFGPKTSVPIYNDSFKRNRI